MKRSEADILRLVGEELEYIADEWNDSIADPALRRGSVALRKLIAEWLLQRAWRLAGFAKEPCVPAFSLEALLEVVDRRASTYAVAG